MSRYLMVNLDGSSTYLDEVTLGNDYPSGTYLYDLVNLWWYSNHDLSSFTQWDGVENENDVPPHIRMLALIT